MTATPPRADLRTLAAEGGAPMTDQAAPSPQSLCDHPVYVHNIRGGEPLIVPICQLCGEIGWDDLREQMAEYRRTVLGEAADELTPPIEWQRHHYGDDAAVRDRVDWIARGRLFGMEDAQATIRLLAAAAPPAGLSATVPAGNAPAVPEGGMGACDRCTGLFLPGDKIAYDADGQYHAEHFPAVPEEADGQRAGQDVDYGPCPHTEALGHLHLEWLAEVADLKAERDALRQHILDIDAHATPFGDIPDEPGWVGTYLVTAGALHRALGKIGHSAPNCQAESERDRLAGEVFTLTNSESLDVVAAELERDEARADRDRLAAQVEELRRYAEEHRQRLLRVREASGEPVEVNQISINLDEADVDALRAEVRRLDHRLRWAYRHSDGDAAASMLVAYELADQRDRLAAQVAQAQRVVARAAGWVPLADVLNALRDHDGFVDWTRTKGPRGYIDDYVVRQYREACADYLAERFAPPAAPEDRT